MPTSMTFTSRVGLSEPALSSRLLERRYGNARMSAYVCVHLGKTRAWNAAGEEPSTLLDRLPAAARADASVGSWTRPPETQGITVLGTPLGHAECVARSLESVREKHAALLDRIPCVPHVQSAWLLLLLCAQPRCNYLLRVLPPGDTGGFAERHDRAVARCLGRLLGGQGEPLVLPELALRRAQLPLRFGGLGLGSAAASRVAAHWASWADSMLVIGARHPRILARLRPGLADPHGALGPPCTRAAAHAEATLRAAGFTAPPWAALVETQRTQVTCPTSGTFRVDGSKPRAPAWTSVFSRRSFPTSIRRFGHCCCFKRGRAEVLFSPPRCLRHCGGPGPARLPVRARCARF